MSVINEFFKATKGKRAPFYPRVHCADGFHMSVQAHYGAYCSPRVDASPFYVEAEIGFPSEREDLIMQYIDGDDSDPTQTVYGYVPVDVIDAVIAKHGGIVWASVAGDMKRAKWTDEQRAALSSATSSAAEG